jgi:hypothetical protein
MPPFDDPVNGFAQMRGHLLGAAGEHDGPLRIQQDVTDTRFPMEQYGNSALQRFDGRKSIALDSGHQEQVGLAI